MTLRQRTPRQKDAKHLAFVRASGCCIPHCRRQAEAAHIRMACLAIGKRETGLQEKPDDKWSVGLCAYHHRIGVMAQHRVNEADFWAAHGINPFAVAETLWISSGASARELASMPVKKPRKIAARQAPEKRKKIRGRIEIRSRGFDKSSRAFQPNPTVNT